MTSERASPEFRSGELGLSIEVFIYQVFYRQNIVLVYISVKANPKRKKNTIRDRLINGWEL